MAWVDTYVSIGRSRLEHDIWVPSVPDDDMECFEHAGHQRAVKAWVIRQQIERWAASGQPKMEGHFRWKKLDANTFSLLVLDPDATE